MYNSETFCILMLSTKFKLVMFIYNVHEHWCVQVCKPEHLTN